MALLGALLGVCCGFPDHEFVSQEEFDELKNGAGGDTSESGGTAGATSESGGTESGGAASGGLGGTSTGGENNAGNPGSGGESGGTGGDASGGTGGSTSGGTGGDASGGTGGETVDGSVFFSEYVESSDAKAVEIHNASSSDVELGDCLINIYFNGNTTPTSTVDLDAVVLAEGDSFVVCHSSAISGCDQYETRLQHNGNDVIELKCDDVVLDVFGKLDDGDNPSWESEDVTLRRVCSVTVGDALGTDAFDPDDEWSTHSVSELDDLGRHCD